MNVVAQRNGRKDFTIVQGFPIATELLTSRSHIQHVYTSCIFHHISPQETLLCRSRSAWSMQADKEFNEYHYLGAMETKDPFGVTSSIP